MSYLIGANLSGANLQKAMKSKVNEHGVKANKRMFAKNIRYL